MESIGTLAGGIAHDFNNILMGIQGRASLSLMQLTDTSPLKEHLTCIEDYVKSAANLTSQLLGFARSGKYHVESTDINEMAEKTLNMFGRTRKELTLVHSLQVDLPAAQVDRNQIEQVLLNLFVNAWQAMPKGGRLEVITHACEIDQVQGRLLSLSPGRYVQLIVTDTGTGIDSDIQQKIFEPFFTTKTRGRGTGLGLASAYGIVRNHHGTIVVESKVGEGATFTIYLPATAARPEKTVENTEEISKGTETILLIDDEPMVIQVASAILNHLGYTVHTAGSGGEAVLWYREHGAIIDLIVLDMIMPEMSGEETFSRLQAINPQVKVLLSSGYSLEGQAEKILAHGCSGFIQKPFDLLQFSRKIREVLDSGADS
jgi:CheY-like chemotaxis protein